MATIRARRQANGTIRYTAVVRIRQGTVVLHQEAKTFAQRAAAASWAKAREVALENPSSPLRQNNKPRTLASLIRWYIDTFKTVSRWQRSKQTHLQFLENHPVGKWNALSITTGQLIKHVQERRAEGAGPATVANDLTWIGVVLRAARSVDGIAVRPDVVQEARTACRELRLIGKARRRERRPTDAELARLKEYFERCDRRSNIPMCDIMDFAIHSARREAEICRIEWDDNDSFGRTGMVRDAKRPREKDGNHRRFKYMPEAWAIVERQPGTSEYIFPYDPKSVGAAFTRVCHVLGIEDLHFHDLRHEATSRLFERGYQIHEVAQFTLHESWNELKRYTNLRPENVREIGGGAPTRRSPARALPSNVITLPVRAGGRSAPRDPRR
jgi:integrase